MIRFTPKTEAQLKEAHLLAEGKCRFEIKRIEARESDKWEGRMIVIYFRATDSNGKEALTSTSIFIDSRDGEKLWRDFMYAAGLEKYYEDGGLPEEDAIGHSGEYINYIKISEKYGKQNAVKSFIPRVNNSVSEGAPFNDAVTF